MNEKLETAIVICSTLCMCNMGGKIAVEKVFQARTIFVKRNQKLS